MAQCDDLKLRLAQTEAQIKTVEDALDATADPDAARRLGGQLAALQAQRTELKILINQTCPAPALELVAATNPAVKTVLYKAKQFEKANRDWLSKFRGA